MRWQIVMIDFPAVRTLRRVRAEIVQLQRKGVYGEMQVGTVKGFDRAKGFGFIEPEHGRDIFFHRTSIPVEGWRGFEAGTPVEFSVESDGQGRRRAVNVRPLEWTANAVAKFLSQSAGSEGN